MTPILQFVPLYQERVWGGRRLETLLGRALPGHGPIGESWEIVDRSEAQSKVRGGVWAGRTLRQALEEYTAEIMGPRWPREKRFPILVKWLDCRERLSLQVHPPASIALKLGGEPKTENWYFLETAAGAAVLAGLKAGVDVAAFARALAAQTAEQCVLRHETHAGDSLLIRSGVMHAIDAGNVILEIQQNSDTTYRVYDWGRVGLDGKPRALHVSESLACLEANTAETPRLVRTDAARSVLADCAEFRITRHRLARGAQLHFAAGEQARLLSVTGGGVNAGGSAFTRGDNMLLPFAGEFTFSAQEDATVLVTDNFTHANP
jgi:mannose-6-phosphate isomerase